MSTLRVTNLQQASSASPNITLDAFGNALINNATLSPTGSSTNTGNIALTGTVAMGSSFKRNRIINGDMTVFQRGTAATTDSAYSVDRWQLIKSNDATESVTQNADAPTGFNYSLRDTISVADTSIGAAQYSGLQQVIEGYNIAGLGFGTATAKSVTLSFWVRSTVTGQYVGSIRNGADTQVCPFNFTINQSNIWEYKTNTFPGSTTGVWNTTNGIGMYVLFYSALGSSFLGGTANTWGANPNYGCGTPVNGLNANGNIFAITGVQLEVGSVATPYERQIYSDQLAQCQRYLPAFAYDATDKMTSFVGQAYSTTAVLIGVPFAVPARVPPTGIIVSGSTHFALSQSNSTRSATTAVNYQQGFISGGALAATVGSAVLTAGNATAFWTNNAAANFYFTGCEL